MLPSLNSSSPLRIDWCTRCASNRVFHNMKCEFCGKIHKEYGRMDERSFVLWGMFVMFLLLVASVGINQLAVH